MKLPLNNLSYPIKIAIGNSIGSGFVIGYNGQSFLVTARHVLYQFEPITKKFLLFDKTVTLLFYAFENNSIQKLPTILKVDLDIIVRDNNIKTNDSIDLVVLKLADFTQPNLTLANGINIVKHASGGLIHYDMSQSKKFDDVEISEDVFVLGYPTSLSAKEMNQLDYDVPLIRKGIVGGKNQLNKTIILDCPVYGGNSGGMVLEVNSENKGIHLIGIVTQFIPYVDRWQNIRSPALTNINLENSGYSVALPVDHIFDLAQLVGKAEELGAKG